MSEKRREQSRMIFFPKSTNLQSIRQTCTIHERYIYIDIENKCAKQISENNMQIENTDIRKEIEI